MAITLTLTYPAGTSIERIKDDADNILSGFGARTAAPSITVDYDGNTEKTAYIAQHVRQQGFNGIAGGR